MAKILVVDDDAFITEVLAENVNKLGHQPYCAATLQDGLQLATREHVDLVFLDVRLPDGNGLKAFPDFLASPSKPEIIIITGAGESEGARMALTSGAWDYMQKPLRQDEIVLHITRVLEYRSNSMQFSRVSLNRNGVVGSSPPLQRVLDEIAQCAGTGVNVLITGETGTGKEVVARTIHRNSSVAKGPFTVVDCAVLPDQLVESILFGHRKGAFTGADRDRKGLVEMAHGGTLFLDEVGELPAHVQKTFLRVLQERRYRPVGARSEAESHFRLLAATNRNLDEMVRAGQFRKDLLFRLRTVAIEVPPLRKRCRDIKDLALHYIHHFCEQHQMETKGFKPEFLELLCAYDWPGNIRELINTIEKAVLTASQNPVLFPMHLPMDLRLHYAQQQIDQNETNPKTLSLSSHAGAPVEISEQLMTSATSYKAFRRTVQEHAERRYFQFLMEACEYEIAAVCARADLSKPRLYALLKDLSVPLNREVVNRGRN